MEDVKRQLDTLIKNMLQCVKEETREQESFLQEEGENSIKAQFCKLQAHSYRLYIAHLQLLAQGLDSYYYQAKAEAYREIGNLCKSRGDRAHNFANDTE